jgi:lipopolysaccharide export system permease protein
MAMLERYILRQLLGPFLLGIFVITFLLTMDFLFDYLDLFLGKGIDLFSVLRLFFLGLGWMLALSVPCGVLVGVLMTYGRMAQDNEIVALRASGLSPFVAVRPALAASVLVAVLLALFNNYVLPDMNHAFANLMLQVNKQRPTAEIQEGVFIDSFKGYNLFIGNLDEKTSNMEDVLIYDFSRKDSPSRTILARGGRLEYDAQHGILVLHLTDGEIHEADEERPAVYHKMDFQKQTLNIRGVREAIRRTQQRARGQREMSIGAMRAKIRDLSANYTSHLGKSTQALEKIGISSVTQLPGMTPKPPWYAQVAALVGWPARTPPALPDSFWTPERRSGAERAKVNHLQAMAAAKKINQYWVEIHKKFSIPFACIIFALLGAPLGIRARRGGLAAGFFSGAFFVFYYLCLVGGEQLADRKILAPWISMWLPNIVLGSLGIWLMLHVCGTVPIRRAQAKG